MLDVKMDDQSAQLWTVLQCLQYYFHINMLAAYSCSFLTEHSSMCYLHAFICSCCWQILTNIQNEEMHCSQKI